MQACPLVGGYSACRSIIASGTNLCCSVLERFVCAPQGMFNDDAFGKMKKGARIVNVARGGVIEEAALARALDNGQVAQVELLCMPLSILGCRRVHASSM